MLLLAFQQQTKEKKRRLRPCCFLRNGSTTSFGPNSYGVSLLLAGLAPNDPHGAVCLVPRKRPPGVQEAILQAAREESCVGEAACGALPWILDHHKLVEVLQSLAEAEAREENVFFELVMLLELFVSWNMEMDEPLVFFFFGVFWVFG